MGYETFSSNTPRAKKIASEMAVYPGSQVSSSVPEEEEEEEKREKEEVTQTAEPEKVLTQPYTYRSFDKFGNAKTEGQTPRYVVKDVTTKEAESEERGASGQTGTSKGGSGGSALGVMGAGYLANELMPEAASAASGGATALQYTPPAFGLGAGEAAGATGFNLAGEVPTGLTEAGGFSGVPEVAGPASALSSWGSAGNALVGSETAGMAAGAVTAIAGGIIAVHQGKQTLQEMQTGDTTGAVVHGAAAGAGAGAAVGSVVAGPIGAGIGAAIGTVVGAVGGAIGASRTGKDKDQITRDAVRDAMQDGGLLDDQYQLTLADGSKFDMGKDGHAKNQDGTGYAYQVASRNPFSVQAVAWADTLSTTLSGGDKKVRTWFAGYFANAAISNARDMETVRANILTMMDKCGLTRQQIEESLIQQKESGAISEQEYAAEMNSLNTLFSGKGYTQMSWEEAEKKFGGGQPTDQNPRSVSAPHPNAPSQQTNPAIQDVDTSLLPAEKTQSLTSLYNYYQQNRMARINSAASGAIKEISTYQAPRVPIINQTNPAIAGNAEAVTSAASQAMTPTPQQTRPQVMVNSGTDSTRNIGHRPM